MPPRLLKRPLIYEDLLIYWEAFKELSRSRQIGFGVGPIPITAVKAYVDMYDWPSVMARELLHYTRALDQVFLDFMEKRSETKKKEKDEDKKRGQLGGRKNIRSRDRDNQS